MRAARLLLLAIVAGATTAAAPAPKAEALPPCYGRTTDWKASIEPGSPEPELLVSGIVPTPTGMNWNVLTLGPTPWDEPARQIIDLQIRALGDIVTNAVTTEKVHARFRVPPTLRGPNGGLVIIQCNGREVGRVHVTAPAAAAR